MTTATFIAKNALRNKRRAALTILSVAVSLFLFVTLLVALREITLPVQDIGGALRVVVRSRISIASPLPARQRAVIERIVGVEAVSPFSWFGGKFRNEEMMTFAQFALDPVLLRKIFGEAKMSEAEYMAFEKDQTACIIGKLTAEKYNLKLGDAIQLSSTIYPCNIELKLAGIYSGTVDDRNLLFHHKYLEEACGVNGEVGTWWIKVRSIDEMSQVVGAINRAFANSSAEVRAETERAFQLSFVSMWGNIKILINSICSVVVFTLLLVTVSTMSMSIRERFQELAVLKAIGYQRRELYGLILAESFGLAMTGALIGIGMAWLSFTHMVAAGMTLAAAAILLLVVAVRSLVRRDWMRGALSLAAAVLLAGVASKLIEAKNISNMTSNIFLSFEVTPKIMGVATLVAANLGLLASLAPLRSVARMSVVDGLKTLD